MPDKRKHDAEKFRRSLVCAMQHLKNAYANLPDDGDPLSQQAVETLTDAHMYLTLLLDQSRVCHPSR